MKKIFFFVFFAISHQMSALEAARQKRALEREIEQIEKELLEIEKDNDEYFSVVHVDGLVCIIYYDQMKN